MAAKNCNDLDPNEGNTLLHLAAGTRSLEEVKLMANKSNVNSQNYRGRTPLHICVLHNRRPNITKCLLHHGADLSFADIWGDTPLHLASKENSLENVKLLVGKCTVNAQNKQGLTALIHSVSRDERSEVTRYLLDHGADTRVADNDGDAPLHWAVQNNSMENCRLLVPKCDVNSVNYDRKAALHVSVQSDILCNTKT